MFSKKSILLIIAIFMLFSCLILSVQAAETQITMRIAHAMPVAHGYNVWAEKFKEELYARVGDKIEVQIFPNAQLGTETEYLEQMKIGAIEGTILGRHAQIDKRLEVVNLPFILQDDAHEDLVLRSGNEIEQKLNNIFLEHGYVCLGWGVLGFRHITTKDREVRRASDLKGLSIRIPNNPLWIPAFQAWGASPTPLDFSELYSALQQGVIDAQENPPEIIYNSRFYEVQKYLNLTSHANIPSQFLVSTNFWNKLSEDIKKSIEEAAIVARDYHVKLTREANINLIAELEKLGMIVIRDVDRESFYEGGQKAYEAYISQCGDELLNDIQKLAK
ncbi:MAG: TRAP dicarboxylate transporter, DctP subunit [Parcubacteria bacterium 34_609]|nr:MAG: TRAP dicarboxylate transporter, DctP subunit [Parcubacteria bacterium 34_609]